MKIQHASNYWTKLFFLISWSLLSYSLIEGIDIFILLIQNRLFYFVLIGIVHIMFYFFCIRILKKKYEHQFGYKEYLTTNIFYSLLICLYSFIYFELIKITDESFNLNTYLVLLLINLAISSIFFLKKANPKK